MMSLTNRHCQPCDLSLHMNDSLREKTFQAFRSHSSHRELLILIVASQFFLVFFGFCGCSYCGCCCVVMGCGSLRFTTSSKWVLRFVRAHGDGKKGRKLSLRSALALNKILQVIVSESAQHFFSHIQAGE